MTPRSPETPLSRAESAHRPAQPLTQFLRFDRRFFGDLTLAIERGVDNPAQPLKVTFDPGEPDCHASTVLDGSFRGAAVAPPFREVFLQSMVGEDHALAVRGRDEVVGESSEAREGVRDPAERVILFVDHFPFFLDERRARFQELERDEHEDRGADQEDREPRVVSAHPILLSSCEFSL